MKGSDTMELKLSVSQLKELTIIKKINLSHILGYETEYFLNCFYGNNTDLEEITEIITIGKLLAILTEIYHVKFDLSYNNSFSLTLSNKKDTPFVGEEPIDILWNILKLYL